MTPLRWEAVAAMLAFVLSLIYIWVPGPYAMGAFTFIAQPLFFVAALGYGLKVLRNLKREKTL